MIGSHNSFTYLKARYSILNIVSFLWRCQSKDITSQINRGASYFDVRVRWSKRKKQWFLAHGLVDLGYAGFNHIRDVCSYIEWFCPSYLKGLFCYRIFLERGNESVKEKFIKEFEETEYKKHCILAGIKKPWTIIYSSSKFTKNVDYSYVPYYTGKRPADAPKFCLTTIKRWAKKHNPVITVDMIKDGHSLYFMDYVGINNNEKT